jgi:predicted transcriptional regulator
MKDALSLSTPALLFPAISLLFLAYTNRFLVLAQLIRQLHGNNRSEIHDIVVRQLKNLRQRILLMKVMQLLGVVRSCTTSRSSAVVNPNFLARIQNPTVLRGWQQIRSR